MNKNGTASISIELEQPPCVTIYAPLSKMPSSVCSLFSHLNSNHKVRTDIGLKPTEHLMQASRDIKSNTQLLSFLEMVLSTPSMITSLSISAPRHNEETGFWRWAMNLPTSHQQD